MIISWSVMPTVMLVAPIAVCMAIVPIVGSYNVAVPHDFPKLTVILVDGMELSVPLIKRFAGSVQIK